MFTRRGFLKTTCCTAAAGVAAASFGRLGLVNALAQTSQDYKALVCIFLFGGTDANNMIIPYTQYSDPGGYDAVLREKLVPLGAEFVSARDVLCNAEGCLTRTGDSAADISTSDQVHLTANGSAFLIDAIIDRLLGGRVSQPK